jgi:hypothetical protein
MKKVLPFLVIVLFCCFLPDLTFGRVKCIEGDCKNSQGTYTWSDAYKYVGEYKDGKKHGRGSERTKEDEKKQDIG